MRFMEIPAPSTKVTAQVMAGSAATVIVWVLMTAGLSVPTPVGMAIAVLLAGAAGYLRRERRPPQSTIDEVKANHW